MLVFLFRIVHVFMSIWKGSDSLMYASSWDYMLNFALKSVKGRSLSEGLDDLSLYEGLDDRPLQTCSIPTAPKTICIDRSKNQKPYTDRSKNHMYRSLQIHQYWSLQYIYRSLYDGYILIPLQGVHTAQSAKCRSLCKSRIPTPLRNDYTDPSLKHIYRSLTQGLWSIPLKDLNIDPSLKMSIPIPPIFVCRSLSYGKRPTPHQGNSADPYTTDPYTTDPYVIFVQNRILV